MFKFHQIYKQFLYLILLYGARLNQDLLTTQVFFKFLLTLTFSGDLINNLIKVFGVDYIFLILL